MQAIVSIGAVNGLLSIVGGLSIGDIVPMASVECSTLEFLEKNKAASFSLYEDERRDKRLTMGLPRAPSMEGRTMNATTPKQTEDNHRLSGRWTAGIYKPGEPITARVLPEGFSVR